MATDINTVTITGRLTRDVEMKSVNNASLAKFSIATSRYAGKEKGEETSFFDVQLWGPLASALEGYLVKAQQVVVKGELVQQRWESENGTRSKVIINADEVLLVGGQTEKKESYQSNGGYPPPKTPEQRREGAKQAKQQGSSPGPESFDDDIPF